ncbi:antA/AntB antirepressor family protein [Snodgrassella sp. CFCC 13594]|uniref:antA/AntB antirepressor family protein n=1 Tax=Snodgrassella sp. CFCC 13594 TaxID=1775559 RepID=UPI00082CBBC9|nr:antA/AntB antirepressor family protein [Snodgrassella sp. CFCC 13594]
MNALIKIDQANFDGQEQQAVNARDLHDFLQVKTRFNDWINNRIKKYGFVENVDFVTLTKNLVNGGFFVEYFINTGMAKELSMVENNAKGREARRYFIDCERQAKQAQIALPKTFSEALRLAADLQDQLSIAAPKAKALDLLSDRSEAFNFRLTAKHLKVKEPVLKQTLIAFGWIYRNGRIEATSKALDAKYMVQVTGVSDANGRQYTQALFTGKGVAKLAEYFSQPEKKTA